MRIVSCGDLVDVRHQVVRNSFWVLADEARSVRTNWIEVAKTDSREVTFLRPADIFQYILDNGLGPTIRARNLTIGLILGTAFLFAIDGRT